jgi:hypothetical protein
MIRSGLFLSINSRKRSFPVDERVISQVFVIEP